MLQPLQTREAPKIEVRNEAEERSALVGGSGRHCASTQSIGGISHGCERGRNLRPKELFLR